MRRGAVALCLILLLGTVAAVSTPELQEDDPGWKCHLMGNRDCGFADPDDSGVVILVHFNEDGEPVGVRKRELPGQVQR